MRSILLHDTNERLDATNAGYVRAAEALLDQGKVNAACQEMRKIQRRVAGTPSVIRLRRRLVESLLGVESN